MGDAAVFVEVDGPEAARSVATAVRAAAPDGVTDVVGGLSSVLIAADPWAAGASGEPIDAGEMVDWLERLAGSAAGPSAMAAAPSVEPRTVVLPVCFGGPDTEDVCRLAGVDPEELAELLGSAPLRVAAVGFSPGFAYLDGVPADLAVVGRLARPRPAVPAGSVALAGGLAAVYPQTTPGGWRLVGRTAARLFDPSAPPYALLRPGDRVRFAAVTGMPEVPEVGPAGPPRRSALQPPPEARAGLVVEHPGLLTLVQDGGRRALAAIGVPTAGPADPVAHRLANRLVGNRPDAGALEVLLSGPALRAQADLHVAITGAAQPHVDGRPVRAGHVVPLAAGQQLAVGALAAGARAYVAVAGGVAVPTVLGSRSTDVLSSLGPGPLVPGDRLGVGAEHAGPLGDHLRPAVLEELRRGVGWGQVRASGGSPGAPPTDWVLRVVAGPHPEWFDDDVLDRVARARYVVTPASDRVGLRLAPAGAGEGAATAVLSRRPGELASQPMVTGAVQVPPDGCPVVLGPDHATLGGYPVVAVVVAADRWAIGQCRPGDTVSFRVVDHAEAVAALARLRRLVEGAVAGVFPLRAG